jgi:hypothetical protein
MRNRVVFIWLLIGFLLVRSYALSKAPQEGTRAGLATAVADAKMSLEQGLTLVMHEGKPISARFEIEDGMLQLSIHRIKDDQFSEVILDPDKKAVAEVDPITSGADYSVAQDQNAAMTRAKRSLLDALTQVLKVNPGFRGVSVFPKIKDGHPVAEITLAKGNEWKTESESLD